VRNQYLLFRWSWLLESSLRCVRVFERDASLETVSLEQLVSLTVCVMGRSRLSKDSSICTCANFRNCMFDCLLMTLVWGYCVFSTLHQLNYTPILGGTYKRLDSYVCRCIFVYL